MLAISPEISEHPEDAVVVRNEPVTLRCAASEAGARITWYKDGKRVVTADMDHKVIARKINFGNLKFAVLL